MPSRDDDHAARIKGEIAGAFRLFDRVICEGRGLPEDDADEAPQRAPGDDAAIDTIGETCATCGGAGTLGARGHEIACPVCNPVHAAVGGSR